MTKYASTIKLTDTLSDLLKNSDTTVGVDTTSISDSYTVTSSTINWGAVGTSALDWGNVTLSNGTSTGLWTTTTSPTTITQSGLMELRGENADIRVNGRSLMESIDRLEQRLNILVPNPELEKEWDELRELGERYRELEKKCKEKGEMWKKLKSMPPPEVE